MWVNFCKVTKKRKQCKRKVVFYFALLSVKDSKLVSLGSSDSYGTAIVMFFYFNFSSMERP